MLEYGADNIRSPYSEEEEDDYGENWTKNLTLIFLHPNSAQNSLTYVFDYYANGNWNWERRKRKNTKRK